MSANTSTVDPAPSESTSGQDICTPNGWKFSQLDTRFGTAYHASDPSKAQEPPLGILAELAGKTFRGTGFNMIFRPNNGVKGGGTVFPQAVTPSPPAKPSDNTLELNRFTETFTFSEPVGSVPNRGLGAQPDIFVNAIMYLQTVNDVTNPATGKTDGKPVPIHIENGMWMHFPPATVNPGGGPIIVRSGTIPHGATIQLQGDEPTTSSNGPPDIPAVSTLPFVPGTPTKTVPFASLTASNGGTPRIPQDLTKIVAHGTITQDMLTNPAAFLTEANKSRKIVKTTTLTMSTATGSSTEPGGGVLNTAFLVGNANAVVPPGGFPGPNALSATVTFSLFFETVEYTLNVSPHSKRHGNGGIEVIHEGIRFLLHPPKSFVQPKAITVQVLELQYIQVVFLTFAGLTWPHPVVSTLKPEKHTVLEDDRAWL